MDKYDEVAERSMKAMNFIPGGTDQDILAAILREAFPQAEASGELDVIEELRIKGHFDRVRDALESTSDPECSRFMRRTKIEQALVSIDQLVLDWRDNRLRTRPAPTAEKALIDRIDRAILNVAHGSQLTLENPKWRLDEEACELLRDAAQALFEWRLIAHEAPKEPD